MNDENDVNMSGGALVDVCSDVNIGNDRSTSEGVPAGMCSDVCNDVSTKNDVNRSGCVVVDVWNDVDFEKDVSCRSGVLGDMCSGANIENGVNRFGGVVVDARSDVDVVDEGVLFDVCGNANVVNVADRNACTYANMEYNTNRTRDMMIDVRSDVNDVNVEDEVSVTANSENDGTRDVPNKTGVSATCCLKIASLNVCGLMSKLKYPEFCEMLVSNDIICLTETKTDDLDSFGFDGFTCFMKNRSIYKRKSGGIALLVRNKILNMVKIVEHADFQRRIEKSLRKFYRFVDFCVFNDGLFFELPCETQNDTNCKKLLVFALYIPPEGSVYSNRSSFTELEETLLHIYLDNVLIMGDLNARTGDSSDYIWDTAALDNVLDDVSTTELMTISNKTRSQDVGKNNFGLALIYFCISQRLLIVNGRVGGDADLGKFTCKNASLVYYVIASSCVFPCICDFYVGDFDECLSDIHCPVFIKLKTGTDSHETIHNVNVSQGMMGFAKPVWRPGDERDYLAEIDEGGVDVIYDRMQKLQESTDSINQSDIDDITDGICSLLTNAAVRLDMYQSQTCMREDKGQKKKKKKKSQEDREIKKKNKYPWFDAERKKKRAEYRKAKGMHKSHANYYTKGERARAHKEYKKVLNMKSRMHTKVFHERIRSLRFSDLPAYWRILNSINVQKKHTVDAISHDLFAEHFEKLGNIPEEELHTFDNETDIFVHDDLENDISADEVLKCTKKLKNKKKPVGMMVYLMNS